VCSPTLGPRSLADIGLSSKKCTKDNSGKANVEPCVNSYVWGVLYAISDADLHRLDEGEMGYRRVQSHVQRQDGASIDAWLYVASVPRFGSGVASLFLVQAISCGRRTRTLASRGA
jgi:Gamma-glutamyl cyclotransferase, AIG2-like